MFCTTQAPETNHDHQILEDNPYSMLKQKTNLQPHESHERYYSFLIPNLEMNVIIWIWETQ